MKKISFLLVSIVILSLYSLYSQQSNTAVIGFYNLENLFDTINDPLTNDEEFLPNGSYQWTSEKYYHKLNHLADVISLIGKENGGVVVLGVSEIENERVLLDLVATNKLKPLNLGVIHHDSPDRRGVDVAFLYDKDRFTCIGSRAFVLKTSDTNFRTRDQFLITGIIDKTDTLHIVVNHWPSKRGGEKRSMPLRIAAAELTRHIADSLLNANPHAKIIIMGDLNDNPDAKSITTYLGAKGKKEETGEKDLFNPMWKMYRDGIGSYAYHDSWELIDNIIISHELLDSQGKGYQFVSSHIFRKNFMVTQTGSFTGYPFRTYSAGAFIGGYSDHFPVYILLKKQ